jgi:hypothetical protein
MEEGFVMSDMCGGKAAKAQSLKVSVESWSSEVLKHCNPGFCLYNLTSYL